MDDKEKYTMTNAQVKAMLDKVSQILIYLDDAREVLDSEPEKSDNEEQDIPVAEVFFLDRSVVTEFNSLRNSDPMRLDHIVDKYHEWAEKFHDVLVYNHQNLWNKTLKADMEEMYAVVSNIRPILKEAEIL